MNIIILGGDGYLGWPVGIHFASQGYSVTLVDNFTRRKMCIEHACPPLFDSCSASERVAKWSSVTGFPIDFIQGDATDYKFITQLVREKAPDTVIHFAEQPSAPYSMRGYEEARFTISNNILGTLTLAHAVKEVDETIHIVKLGTMGEYGTPNIDIEEGFITITHKGREETFLYPREAGSLYHTSKIQDTDLLYFYVRMYGLRVTDLMQGPVYGFDTPEMCGMIEFRTFLNYDSIFGTVFNRFLAQAVSGNPLTIYGGGGQVRGYLNLLDTIQCISLAVKNPSSVGQMRILNQFTEQFSVRELASLVREAAQGLGIRVTSQNLPNPRIEKEDHYYAPSNSSFLELGLKPHYLTKDRISEMLEQILPMAQNINPDHFNPNVRWNQSRK